MCLVKLIFGLPLGIVSGWGITVNLIGRRSDHPLNPLEYWVKNKRQGRCLSVYWPKRWQNLSKSLRTISRLYRWLSGEVSS